MLGMSLMLTKTTIRVSAPSCTTLVFFPPFCWPLEIPAFSGWFHSRISHGKSSKSRISSLTCPGWIDTAHAFARFGKPWLLTGDDGFSGWKWRLNDTNWCVFNDGNGNLTQVIVTIYNNIQKMGYDSIIIGIWWAYRESTIGSIQLDVLFSQHLHPSLPSFSGLLFLKVFRLILLSRKAFNGHM